MTFDGAFDAGLHLADLIDIGALPTRDVEFRPDPEDRKPCPECGQVAESMLYENCRVRNVVESTGDPMYSNEVSVRVDMDARTVLYPCGHRFDAMTGALVEGE